MDKNNKNVIKYKVDEPKVMLTEKLFNILYDGDLTKSEIVLFLKMLQYMKGLSYELSLSVSKIADAAVVDKTNVYKHIRNLKKKKLIAISRKENNVLRIFIHPFFVTQGPKIFKETLDLFTKDENLPECARKEKEENIVYDVGY